MNDSDLLKKLAVTLGEDENTPNEDISIELFWKGVRDWLYQEKDATLRSDRMNKLVDECESVLIEVREKVEKFDQENRNAFRDLTSFAYRLCEKEKLENNLRNTEIDIVLASPTKIFIGEAKLSQGFGSDSRHVLVHQLIRQFVVAQGMVNILEPGKEVVPFVVVRKSQFNNWWQSIEDESPIYKKCPAQVKFMIEKMGMKPGNCLTWEGISQMFPQ